jgi:hypothetical protein
MDLYWKRATTNYPVEALMVFACKREQLRFVSGVEGLHHLLGLSVREVECRPDQADAPPNGFPVDCGHSASLVVSHCHRPMFLIAVGSVLDLFFLQ